MSTINRDVPKSDLSVETLRRAREIFGPSEAIADNVRWPYGMSALNAKPGWQQEMVDWAWTRELRANETGCHCLTWLLREEDVNCWEVEEHPNCSPARFDHLVAFTRDGKPAVIVNSPYDLSGSGIQHLAELSSVKGVYATVSGTWYRRGTFGLYLWNDARHLEWVNRPR